MVLKDEDLDALWRVLGTHRGETRNHIEAAIQEEQTAFSHVTERLFREYRDLKAEYERLAESKKSLVESKKSDPKAELQVFERELSHLVSDVASFNMDKQSIVIRVVDMRNKIRSRMQALGYQGRF